MSSREVCRSGFVLIAMMVAVNCSENDGIISQHPPSPGATSDVRLAAADVRIDGSSVDGSTIPAGSGESTLFTATLADPTDRSRVRRMQMDYPVHSGMGMMGSWSSVDCYDDGTHGDEVAGDGTYSYSDMDHHIGPHYQDCVAGEYEYHFHGTDLADRHTNSVVARVTVR